MSNNQKRLLCIVSSMDAGGAETFLMKIYRALDKSKYQMDFFVSSFTPGFYENEILSMGGKIFRSVPKSKSPIKAFIDIQQTVRREKYQYVMRLSQHSLATLDLLAAKAGGAKVLIYRSTNAKIDGRLSRFLDVLFKFLTRKVPTVKVAPSTEAAEFAFGKDCVSNGHTIILKNGIAIENFLFNQDKRDKIRKEFKIDNQFVVGHVGRFNNQKNHNYLIDIFSEIVKRNQNSVLILVGKGELESNIRMKINNLSLANKVIFTGIRSDVADIMMAMDVFIFPSFFEGMPNTVIEAQATGLPCIISDTITREAQITNFIDYLSINERPEVWARTTLKYANGFERKNMHTEFIDAGYEINTIVKDFVNLVFGIKN